jgi:hypothetical protein
MRVLSCVETFAINHFNFNIVSCLPLTAPPILIEANTLGLLSRTHAMYDTLLLRLSHAEIYASHDASNALLFPSRSTNLAGLWISPWLMESASSMTCRLCSFSLVQVHEKLWMTSATTVRSLFVACIHSVCRWYRCIIFVYIFQSYTTW